MSDIDTARRAWMAFQRARGKAFLRRIGATLRGRPNQLLPYDAVRKMLRAGGPVYRGLKTVPISQIVGSVNRYRDFDRAFLPSQRQTEQRWENIGRAYFDNVSLPPVKLYQIGDAYFVVDGNHRVSVARAFGQEFIDAEVQEVRSRVPLSADMDPAEIEISGAKADFLAQTHLDETRPALDFDLTIPDGYELLLGHIEGHRYLQSQEWKREFGLGEAAIQWCDQVYLPLVKVIRQTKILQEFPGHTEGDLYVWVIEHQYYLREQFGAGISLEDAARSFGQRFTGRLSSRVWHWIARHILRIQT